MRSIERRLSRLENRDRGTCIIMAGGKDATTLLREMQAVERSGRHALVVHTGIPRDPVNN